MRTMQCLGRTKSLERCKSRARFLVCHRHTLQLVVLLLITIPGLSVYKIYIKPIVSNGAQDDTLSDIAIQPFTENDSAFKVLILPFDPLEDCSTRESDLAKAVYKRLVSLKEQDTFEISVKYETTQACPATFAEGRDIGNDFNADLVIWGETYEKCLLDTAKACLKYVLLKEARYKIERVGSTDIQRFASVAEITQGYLQKDSDYIIYWTLGLEAYTKNDYTTALEYFEKIEAAFSEQYQELFFYLGFICSELNQYDKSADAYKAVININPDYADAHYNYAILLYKHFQDYGGAKQHYLQALRVNPDYADAHNNYATLLMDDLQDYEGAREHYLKALRVNPNYADAHYNYAILLHKHFQDYGGAKQHYLQALRVNPDYAGAYNNYATLLMDHLQDYEGAREYYLKALRVNPDLAQAHNNFAILLYRHFQDYNGAKQHYLKACELNSTLRNQEADTIFGVAAK